MKRLDWQRIEDELNDHGCAVVPGLLEADACLALAAQYDQPERFRLLVAALHLSFRSMPTDGGATISLDDIRMYF